MTQPAESRGHRFTLWSRLTEPGPAVVGETDRGKARLMASLTLAGMPVVATIALIARFAGAYVVAIDIWFTICLLVIVGLMVAYWMSRKGRYQWANLLVIVLATVSVLIPAPLLGGPLSYNSLFYLAVVTLFSSLYQSTRIAIGVFSAHLVGILIAGAVMPDVALQDVIIGPFIFNLFASGSILLFVYHQRQTVQQQQTALSLSEARYRMISEVMSDYAFYYRVEPDGKLTLDWITDSFTRITGYSTEGLSLDSFAHVVYPEDLPRLERDRQMIVNGQGSVSEYRIITRDGRLRWLRIHRRPVWNPDHTRVIGGYGAVQDITEHKQAEAQKIKLTLEEERLHMVSQFVPALSHDFRTLLATIETSRYLIEKLISDHERAKIQPKLMTIQRSVMHLTEQIDNLQMVASVASLYRTKVDLNGLLETLLVNIRAKAQEKQIMVQFRPDAPVQPVEIDQSKIERAIRHLLMNAVAHTDAEGLITVRSYQQGQQAVVEVEDTGSGIAPEILAQIFEPFYRGDTSRPVERGGIGLGLTIVKMIIEAHGGSIQVNSQVGEGSLFTIKLPRSVEALYVESLPV